MTELDYSDLHRVERDDRYLGGGYIGERNRAIAHADAVDHGYSEEDGVFHSRPRILEVDAAIIRFANDHGWTYEDLFAWANSKHGRWLADSMFNDAPFDRMWASAVRELVVPTEG